MIHGYTLKFWFSGNMEDAVLRALQERFPDAALEFLTSKEWEPSSWDAIRTHQALPSTKSHVVARDLEASRHYHVAYMVDLDCTVVGLIADDRTFLRDKALSLLAELPAPVHVQLRRTVRRMEWPPVPPLLGSLYGRNQRLVEHLAVVTKAAVDEAYTDPSAFWSIWDGQEQVGDQVVVWRGLEDDEEAFARRDLADRFHCMRAAAPWATTYSVIPVGISAEEQQVLLETDSVLGFVGYVASKKQLNYAAHLTPQQHVGAAEWFTLAGVLVKGQDSLGREVHEVRVHFATEAMARREMRPLVEVGIRVFTTDPETGQDLELPVGDEQLGLREVSYDDGVLVLEEVGPINLPERYRIRRWAVSGEDDTGRSIRTLEIRQANAKAARKRHGGLGSKWPVTHTYPSGGDWVAYKR